MSEDEAEESSDEMTPEQNIAHLQERLLQETDRLTKLFDAYEEQHKEFIDAKAEIDVLEREIVEKDIDREGLESLIGEKDDRFRELETRFAKSNKRLEYYEVELPKMEEKYQREKERLGRVFELAEELDDDLRMAVVEMKARDEWYVEHLQLFEDLNTAIKKRYTMVEEALETERKSGHRHRALEERLTSLVDARAAEMTIEEAEKALSDENDDVIPKADEESESQDSETNEDDKEDGSLDDIKSTEEAEETDEVDETS